ncbi:MAG: hypothetical protein HYZ42_01285 [Bacteroidetes bacterium]|nr:hypothetical protein [Bacteroidota bacterium]
MQLANKDTSFKRLFSVLVFICLGIQLSTLLYSLNKGFDIDDEGCLLLMAKPEQELDYFIFKIQAAPYYIFHWITPSIFNFRLLSIVILSTSSIVSGFLFFNS